MRGVFDRKSRSRLSERAYVLSTAVVPWGGEGVESVKT